MEECYFLLAHRPCVAFWEQLVGRCGIQGHWTRRICKLVQQESCCYMLLPTGAWRTRLELLTTVGVGALSDGSLGQKPSFVVTGQGRHFLGR